MSSNLTSVSITLATADADGIFLSANPANNATLTLDGALVTDGVAIMDVARRIVVTSSADDSLIVFNFTGTDRSGNVQTESILGSNASTAVTTKDFKTVTGVTITGNAGTITIGTNGQASSAWIPTNHAKSANIGFGVELSRTNGAVSAALTYTVEHTFHNLQSSPTARQSAIAYAHDDVASETTEQDGNYAFGISATRLTLNAFTSGTATMNIVFGLGGM